ncbi:MAG TPA: hypothetical protein VK968_19675 [Roseimicrobium sp.]|nr:hypothetical protein [Roseimicrobium sp.]
MKWIASIQEKFVIFMWKITPDCAEMSRLSSKGLDQPLGFRMWLRMRLHFIICVWCRRYYKQLRFMHHAAPGLHDHGPEGTRVGLSADAKKRLKESLRKAGES